MCPLKKPAPVFFLSTPTCLNPQGPDHFLSHNGSETVETTGDPKKGRHVKSDNAGVVSRWTRDKCLWLFSPSPSLGTLVRKERERPMPNSREKLVTTTARVSGTGWPARPGAGNDGILERPSKKVVRGKRPSLLSLFSSPVYSELFFLSDNCLVTMCVCAFLRRKRQPFDT